MVTKLNSSLLLSDTLHLVQLARQAALARGQQDQVEKLSSVASGLQKVVTEVGTPPQRSSAEKAAPQSQTTPSGLMAQEDFSFMLSIARKGTNSVSAAAPASQAAINQRSERNQLAIAMAAGGMSELDIARQLGMTRDEVHILVSLNQANNAYLK